MIAEIKALDPKPGLAFDAPAAETLIPDIMLRSMADGGWQIELNSDTLPRVLVNRQYHAALSKRSRDKADKEFLTDCLQSANWLVRALHQRATTILKVATEIVRQQDAFFRKGVAHLRPLTLREVAEAIEMHESTVSRVTTNKYMTTPRGIYELKYFFTAAIAGTSGDSVSAEAVRHRIRGLIEAESPSAVLSDDTLVELLRRDGVDIARRTVAKYREALRIPSSVQRRRDKAVHL
jgi:RNA polymerase sigma-54 factor